MNRFSLVAVVNGSQLRHQEGPACHSGDAGGGGPNLGSNGWA
jgi:hypothetical protein